MKQLSIVLLSAILLCFSHEPLKAQQAQGSIDYSEISLLGAGVSLGYYSYGYLGSRSLSLPPLSASYEMGFHEYITAGPFVGFARWNYSYTNYSYAWSFIQLGGRASFHLTSIINDVLDLEIDESKIDWYVSMLAGLELRQYSAGTGTFREDYANTTRVFLGPIAGIRYYLNDRIALYFEGGRGSFGAATFGVSTRF